MTPALGASWRRLACLRLACLRPASLRPSLAGAALAATLAAVALTGCGRDSSVPASHETTRSAEETVRHGEVSMTVSAIQAHRLSPQIAARYGAEHEAGTVLVVVSLRRGEDASAVPLAARQVMVTASDLLGRKQALAMREVRDGDLRDQVGLARITPPETLAFDVVAEDERGQRYRARFNRDFFR